MKGNISKLGMWKAKKRGKQQTFVIKLDKQGVMQGKRKTRNEGRL